MNTTRLLGDFVSVGKGKNETFLYPQRTESQSEQTDDTMAQAGESCSLKDFAKEESVMLP